MNHMSVDCLGGTGQTISPPMDLALSASFGSVTHWRAAFAALAMAQGANGWLMLAFQPGDGRLVNLWAADLDAVSATAVPLLALELATHTPVDAAMADMAWDKIYANYQHAVHAVGDALAADAASVGDAVLIDVRRAGVFEQATSMLPGATWCDPAKVAQWVSTLPADRQVLVYCVYGHEVGRATAMRLHAAGVKARFLLGGIDGWQKAGQPVQAKTT